MTFRQNHYPTEQNKGFYPLKITTRTLAYSENVLDVEIISFSIEILQKAYQNEKDVFKYIPENHPNPLNRMNSNKPIKLGDIDVVFGDHVPFIKNGSNIEIIKQEIIIQFLLLDRYGNNVFNQEYKITQNQTHNELKRKLDFMLYIQDLNFNFRTDSGKEENFTIFYGIKFGNTFSNGSQSYGVDTYGTSSIYFDHEKDAFTLLNSGSKPDFSNFSIIWHDKPKETMILIGIGTLFFILSILVVKEFKKYRATLIRDISSK